MKLNKTVLLLCLCLSNTLSARTFYVSQKNGSDANSGTKESPVATLTAARDLIRHHKNMANDAESFEVLIHAGTYNQTTSFTLNSMDAGTASHPIRWKAVAGEKVVISGGQTLNINKFKPLADKTGLKRIPKSVHQQVLEYDLKADGITEYGQLTQYGHALGVTEAPLELFVDKKAMTLARYPNSGYVRIGKIIDAGSCPRVGDYSNKGATFSYTDTRHSRWSKETDIWLQGTFHNGYADDNIRIEQIDTKRKQIKLAQPHMYSVGSGAAYQHYVAQNIIQELDSVSEWYLDRQRGKLYFFPETAITPQTEIAVSLLEDPIISLEGVAHVIVENLIVENGRGIGIYIERCNNVVVGGCTVRNVGTNGIFMGQGAKQTFPSITHDDYEGVPISKRVGNLQGHIYKHTNWDRLAGSNITIQSCDVYATGSGGIYLSGGSKRKLIPGNNRVENCKIHDFNRRNKFLWAGVNVDGCGNTVSHCEIFNSDFQGIYVHGNDHLFQYNEIHHVTLNSDDTSPWYIGRDPSDRGNIVRYNYFHHCGNKNRSTMGIYCDDSTTDVAVFGNVFYKMDTRNGMLFSNTGWDLSFENNIVIEPMAATVRISNHLYTWGAKQAAKAFSPIGVLNHRMMQSVDIYSEPYSVRYPELALYLQPIVEGKEWEGMRCRGNIMARNLIVAGPKKSLTLIGPYAQCDTLSNYQTQSDPGFVDYKKQNFNLKPDSEVFKKIKGFQTVPFDKMGLRTDMYRVVNK